MESSPVKPVQIHRFAASKLQAQADLLAVEEPLEMQLWYGPEANRRKISLNLTMRTPGHDFELVVGFLYAEGIISDYHDLSEIRYCTDVKSPEELGNVVILKLKPELPFDPEKNQRNFFSSSACGVCGKTSIESISSGSCPRPLPGKPTLNSNFLFSIREKMEGAQPLFKRTGGIHAAALFDADGQLIRVREDIGRHNAVDKVIGAALHESELPLQEQILWVSGRAGFELVQKAAQAGIPIMAAVGAPSSLAVDLAQEQGMTLIGFLREDKFNVYTGPERISS